jgi:catechol 2,3-dioxygenase-like lactoylglutathione lyase family enzyme
MIHGLWNYAIKAADLAATTEFYVRHMGGELRMNGEVFGCQFNFLRLGDTRLLVFDRAPYEETHGMNLPPGFLHLVYEVDNLDEHVAMLRQTGVRWLMEPQEIDLELGRRKIAFFVDPNGIRTEVMEILEDRSTI